MILCIYLLPVLVFIAVQAFLWLWYVGASLCSHQSPGSRAHRLNNCDSPALEHRLDSCGAQGLAGSSQIAPVVKNLSVNAGDIRDAGSIPGSGRLPGGGHGNPFQYSCLENPMDRGAWQTAVHRITHSRTQALTVLPILQNVGIFLDQGSNPYLLQWQVDSLLLSYQGSPWTGLVL